MLNQVIGLIILLILLVVLTVNPDKNNERINRQH